MKIKILIFFYGFVYAPIHAQLIPISYNLNNRELVNIALPKYGKDQLFFQDPT
jgi:hypothetical protein